MPTFPEPYLAQQFPNPPVPSPFFVFAEGAPRDGNRIGNWAELCTAIGLLPEGIAPIVTFDGPATIPAAGCPAGGWDMRGANWRSVSHATGDGGAVVVEAGAVVRNLHGIINGLRVGFLPLVDVPALAYDWDRVVVLTVERGAVLTNDGPGPLVQTPGTGAYFVLSCAYAAWGAAPPLAAPIVDAGASGLDIVINVLEGTNPFARMPDGWLVGAGATLIYQLGPTDAVPATPGWTGPAATILRSVCEPEAMPYGASIPAHWLGAAPTLVGDAIDRLAAAVAGLLGAPIP